MTIRASFYHLYLDVEFARICVVTIDGEHYLRRTDFANTSWNRLGGQIDRLVTVEYRPEMGSVPPGLVTPLYELCAQRHGGPLSTSAASLLLESAQDGPVIVVTGAGVAPALPRGETDGPPGAVALMKTLQTALGQTSYVVTEENHAPAVEACLDVAELSRNLLHLFPQSDVGSSIDFANSLIDQLKPGVIVFIERDGSNCEGRYHGVRGNCRPESSVARADLLAVAAARRGIPTIGIGDGGNEVGFGGIRSEVAEIFPDAAVCKEGCPSGRISAVATDICVSASVSNWAAYAVCAAIACATNNLRALPSPELEVPYLQACVEAGAIDGATGHATLSVDGITTEGNRSVLTLLGEVSRMYCRS